MLENECPQAHADEWHQQIVTSPGDYLIDNLLRYGWKYHDHQCPGDRAQQCRKCQKWITPHIRKDSYKDLHSSTIANRQASDNPSGTIKGELMKTPPKNYIFFAIICGSNLLTIV